MQDPTQITPNTLDQDQSRAALGVITYLMTHTLPPSRMQSQAQPNKDGQPQEQAQQKPQEQQQEAPQPQQPQPQQPPVDPTAELKGQMDSMKIEHDAKLKSIVEHQQQEIDQLKKMIEQALSEDEPTQTA